MLDDIAVNRASRDMASLSYNSALEARLSVLERHLHALLTWQQSIGSLSTVTAAAIHDLYSHQGTHQDTKEKDGLPIKLEASAELTAPTTPIPSTPPTKTVKPLEPAKEILSLHVAELKAPVVEVKAHLEFLIPEIPLELSPVSEKPATRLAHDILDVIQHYGQHLHVAPEAASGGTWIGKAMFVARVEKQVELDEPIKMIMPSFPWKSINRTEKVNGCLPDLGEELALARLNSLCKDIEKVYPKGAELTIATDGLVFDDLVGIPDEDTWAYSECLMEMAAREGSTNIKLLRVMDLLGLTAGETTTKDMYMSMTANSRKALLEQYGRSEDEVREMIQSNEDTLLTYRGFIRFLETDLKYSPVVKKAQSGQQFRKCVKKVAMGMMIRAESFTKLIQAKCSAYVRLSIHPSSGGVKLSIPLIPQENGVFPRTPWHCTIAVGIDGAYRTVHVKDVRDTHNLIYHNDRPYYYREKSELWDWEDANVVFEPQYPSGVLVRPRASTEGLQVLTTDQLDKLRQLAQLQPVNVRGFADSANTVLAASA